MNENKNHALLMQINKLKNLPALPEASTRILDAINDSEIPIDQLAAVLSLSPGVVARLLGLANSAYFGQSRSISNLPAAIFEVLGLDLVKTLTLSIVLNVQFDTRKCQGFDTKYFWMRSLLTALAAQKLANSQKQLKLSTSTAYTSGLLLNIGVLILGYLTPQELNEIFQRSLQNQSFISEEIHQHLGISHYLLGSYLLQKRQLSPMFPLVLNHFEDPDFSGEERPLINLLNLSQQLSFMLLHNDEVDLVEIETIGKNLALSTVDFPRIVAQLIEKRESIGNLAAVLGN
jgi:HD-like signal output (HDOD) protein